MVTRMRGADKSVGRESGEGVAHHGGGSRDGAWRRWEGMEGSTNWREEDWGGVEAGAGAGGWFTCTALPSPPPESSPLLGTNSQTPSTAPRHPSCAPQCLPQLIPPAQVSQPFLRLLSNPSQLHAPAPLAYILGHVGRRRAAHEDRVDGAGVIRRDV